jgi:hypothetical protein
MGTMLTIITALILITSFLIAAIIHIRKIQTALEEISEEQSRQNEDIRNLMIAHYQIIQALKQANEDARMIYEARRTKYEA